MISLKMELWVVFLNASFSIYREREFTARLTAYESIVTVTLKRYIREGDGLEY